MEELRLTYQQAATYAVILNVVISLLFGFFPLITGLKLGNRKYALVAIIGSAVLGIVGIILSFPFAAIMQWLIVKNARSSETPGDTASGLTPAANS